MLMKWVREDLNKWRDTPCSWTERLNIGKIAAFPKNDNTGLMQFLIKILARFSIDINKLIL